MTITITPVDVVLTDTAAVMFTATTGVQFVALKASVTNTDASDHTVTVYRVPPSGTADIVNIIGADAVVVPAGQTVVLPLGGQGVVDGQSIQALASVTSVVNFNATFAQVT